MAARLTDTELDAWLSFLQAHHGVIRELDEEMRREHRLPLGSYEVLLFLSRQPDQCMKMSDLARAVLLSPSGLTRLVDRLERDGLVERARAATDARFVRTHLTALGRQRFRTAARTHVRGIKEHFTGRLNEAQLIELKSVMSAVIATCDQIGE